MQQDDAPGEPARRILLPRPLLALAWLLLLAGTAAFAAWRARPADQAPSGPAAATFWELRNAQGRAQPVRDDTGLRLRPGETLALRAPDDPQKRLQAVVVRVVQPDEATQLEVTLREQDERSYGVLVTPGAGWSVSFQYRERGAAPVVLARGQPAAAPSDPDASVELRIELAEDRFAVQVDDQQVLTCRDARLRDGRTSLLVRRGACTVQSLGATGTQRSQTGQSMPLRNLEDFRPEARAPALRRHAESLGLALCAFLLACLYLATAARGTPPVAALLHAGAVSLAFAGLPFALARLRPGLDPLPAAAVAGVAGLGLGLLVLRPFAAGTVERRAWRRALDAAIALSLVVVTGSVLAARDDLARAPRLAAERLAASAEPAPPFTLEEPLSLDAGNALVIPPSFRDLDLRATVTLAPDSLLELRLRATTPPSCRGVALWLPTDARLRTGFVLEDLQECAALGTDAPAVRPGEPIELTVSVRGRDVSAAAGGWRVEASDDTFAAGSVILLAARGTVEVGALELLPVPATPVPVASRTGWLVAALVPAAGLLLFAAAAAALLRQPFGRLLAASAFALLPFALARSPWAGEADLSFEAVVQLGLISSLLLALPVCVPWRAPSVARGALVLVLALLAPPAVVLATGAGVPRPAWLWWRGERLAPDLAYLQHPLLRSLNGYLADHAFRSRRFAPDKPPGTARVITLGASSTFGYGLPEGSGQDYPTVLEHLLDERAAASGGSLRDVEVINAACLGSTGERQLRLLRDGLLGFDPDVVTVSFFYNDSFALTSADEAALLERLSAPGYSPSLPGDLRGMLAMRQGTSRMTALDHAFRASDGSTLELWRELDPDADESSPPERFAAMLHRYAELARERGFALVLVKEPARDERMPWKEEFYAAIDQVAAEHGLHVVDPSPALAAEGGRELFMDVIHPKPRGLEIIAGELAPAVGECLGL